MKKILLTLAATAFLSSAAQAQLNRHRHSFAGVKAGGTAASFIGEQAKLDRYIYGYHAGIFANLALNQPFSLQPEILFSLKGSQGQIEVSDAKQELAYIDVPVPVRITKDGLFVEGGPQVGFLLSAKSSLAGTKTDVKDLYRPIDFGFVAGLGYQPETGGLGFGARYNGGFISVRRPVLEGTDAVDIRNSDFQLYLTYSRSHKKKSSKSSKSVK